jgi:rhodanese-related sulfurtransferase
MIRLSTVSVLLCLLIMAGAFGCSNRQADSAAAEAKVVDAAEFQELADAGGEDVVILDVRTPGEFAGGHVPGAVNVDINASDFDEKIAGLDPDKTYLVYCRSGGRSARACSMMAKQAIPAKAIYDLDGGITAWESAGKPVEK